jgi:hypothetical protein
MTITGINPRAAADKSLLSQALAFSIARVRDLALSFSLEIRPFQ